jgi:hypothetical protein
MTTEDDKINEMPPLPIAFYDWTLEEHELFKFKGELTSMNERKNHKIYHIWRLWAEHSTNPSFLDMIQPKIGEEETEQEKRLKVCIFQLLDKMAKILTNTELVEELQS